MARETEQLGTDTIAHDNSENGKQLESEECPGLYEKHPISLLTELSVTHSINFKIDYKENRDMSNGHLEGATNALGFTSNLISYSPSTCLYTVNMQFDKFKSTYTAPSKKKAKWLAALDLLRSIANSDSCQLPFHSIVKNFCAQASSECAHPDLFHNPVGDLHKLITRANRPQPTYVIDQVPNTSYDMRYLCRLYIEDAVYTGYGVSKKMAKRTAASKVLSEVQLVASGSIPIEEDSLQAKLAEFAKAINFIDSKASVRPASETTLESMFSASCPMVETLKEADLLTFDSVVIGFVDFLVKFASNYSLDIEFAVIPTDKENKGDEVCGVVRLDSSPAIACPATGRDYQEVFEKAARQVLYSVAAKIQSNGEKSS